MVKLYVDSDRYGDAPASLLVEAVHNSVRDLVRRRWQESGKDWASFVFDASNTALTKADFEAIEQRLLSTGHRFAWSSMLSLRDRPEIYVGGDTGQDMTTFSFEHPDAPKVVDEGDGRKLHGVGDNVVRHAQNTIGTACYIRSSERVIEFMKNGVPPDLIAIIDDSGGTLTAPILERFKGVVCAGGTVRSHLGILTREYGIPCLMNSKITGIREGDRVELETSAVAKTAEAYQRNQEMAARIWRLS